MDASIDPMSLGVGSAAGAPAALGEGDAFSLQFEQASIIQTDREIAVPLTPQYSSFKKLEVITSRRINQMTKLYNVVLLIALGLSTAVVIIARTLYSEKFEDVPIFLQNQDLLFIDITVYTFPPYFTIVDSTLSFIVFATSLVLLLLYCYLLLTRRRGEILNEQVWVILLLVSAVIYLNPHEAIVRIRRDVLGIASPADQTGFNYQDIFTSARFLSFSVIYWLYLWMGAHSYRFLERRASWRDWPFYFFKMLTIAVYVMYKLFILFKYRIVFSEVPFATFVAFLNLYGSISLWPKAGIISVVVLTILELVIAGLIALDVRKSFVLLKASDYTKHRTKILGYRFFLHQQVVFNIVYIVTYAFLLFGLPIGIQTFQFYLMYDIQPGRGSYFDVQYAPFGLHLCLLSFIATEAYTNLPAHVNIRKAMFPWYFKRYGEGWDEHEASCPEPVVYRNREPPSIPGNSMEIRPNCFIMQTNIELFNLSWFVYYHGTEKERNLNINFDQLSLKIRDCLYDPATDTKAIVAESPDRIIFAFKGTSSSQNLVTDLKVNHRPLSSVIGNRSSSILQRVRSNKSFHRAKIHAGFATAYNAIKERVLDITTSLLKEKQRPVCFTGHSLGGALATLSSLDVYVSLGVESTKVAVSSFGSPRVGNEAFQQLYDETVQTHWRFVAGGDLISRLPKIGYKHVGKKVVLTATGELFIDPSALEIIFWHSQTASIVHHRKACYLLALKSWCDSRGEYVPNLWPFPVSANDSRKFVSSFQKPNTQVGVSSRLKRTEAPEDRAARMQGYADAIDALDIPTPEAMSQRSVNLWRRITSAALDDLSAPADMAIETPRNDNNVQPSGLSPTE